ncbi:type VII secretion protein EccB [Nocardioides litoris]|uniref:type VII secretion protein EccB n=1 Tax=Nocardioides litoris TaxID=1926648 RepID=UPI0014771073|nr:type VII secretion protein EccB [Nocardioides litoris]
MQTRRDQLHAYRFMTRRAMSALVTGEPDTVEPPMRRLVVMTLSGVMVAIAVAAVFAIIGLLRPGGGDQWKAEGVVIVERDTGARYVILGEELHPVLNYPSAVLASGSQGKVKVELVRSDKLDELPPGDTIGIAGLPDSVPSEESLIQAPVVLCSQSASAEGNASARTEVSLEVGTGEAPDPLPDGTGVLVTTLTSSGEPDESSLLLGGVRYPIANERVEDALFSADQAVPVGRSFLAALPVSPTPLAPLEVPGRGQPVQVAGRALEVGQLVTSDTDPEDQRVVVGEDSLIPVTSLQAELLLALPQREQPAPPVSLPEADIVEAAPSDEQVADFNDLTRGLPDATPELSDDAVDQVGVCATFDGRDGGGEPAVLGVPRTDPATRPPTADGPNATAGLVDRVDVRTGSGLLARTPQAAAVNLVLGPGLRFPATDLATLGGFGYSEDQVQTLPDELVAVIPDGPGFDREDARRPQVLDPGAEEPAPVAGAAGS